MWTELVKELDALPYPNGNLGKPKWGASEAELALYEKRLQSYKVEKWNYATKKAELENKIAEAMLDELSIPTQYRAKCWKLAWEYGHSGGYYEVWNYLLDLKTIFE